MTADEKQKLRAAIKLVRGYCRKKARRCFAAHCHTIGDYDSETSRLEQDEQQYTATAEHLNSVLRRLPK